MDTVPITNPLYSAHSLPPYHNAAFDHSPHPYDHRHPQRQSLQPRSRPSGSNHATLQVRPQKKFAENSTGLQKVMGPFQLSPLTPKEPRPPKKGDFGPVSSLLPQPDDPLPSAIDDPSTPSATNLAETPVNDQIVPRSPPQPSFTPGGHKASFPIPFDEVSARTASPDGPVPSAFPSPVHLSQPPAVRPSSPTPRPPTADLTSQIDSEFLKTPSSTPLEGRTDDFRGVDFRFEDATTSPSKLPAVRPSSPTPGPPTADLTSQIDSPCSKTPSSTPLEGRTDDFRGVDFRFEDATTPEF
jgi:hypothetical protein